MNYLSILNYGNKILKSKKITSYKLDTELILAKVLNKSREEILTNLNLTLKEKDFYSFKKLLIRRKKKRAHGLYF